VWHWRLQSPTDQDGKLCYSEQSLNNITEYNKRGEEKKIQSRMTRYNYVTSNEELLGYEEKQRR
jgi:hypothetical protein